MNNQSHKRTLHRGQVFDPKFRLRDPAPVRPSAAGMSNLAKLLRSPAAKAVATPRRPAERVAVRGASFADAVSGWLGRG